MGWWLFAGTDSGIFQNYGSGWEPYSDGLIDYGVVSVAVADWELYAGTRAAGLFHGSPPVGIGDRPTDAPRHSWYSGPTIVRNAIILRGVTHAARTCLVDACGRRAMDLHSGANDVRALAPGVYFVCQGAGRREQGGDRVSKVVVTR
jgi:hypothetical protein